MAVFEYCAKHNMIAYLEKIKENAQFHEIVDFLSRSSIFYALTVSPDVCTSFIEQFWKTTTFKTINNISHINAQVARKPVVITEASIRSDLLFNDVDGIDCKITHLFPSMLTQAAVEEGEDSGTPTESQPTPSPTQPSGHTSDRAEGSLNLKELSALCTNLSNRVFALGTVKDAQAKEILTLKARIKKLEKRCKPSISHHRAWLRSVSLLSKKKKLSKRESVSKQGRKNAESGPTKDDSAELDAELDEDMDIVDTATPDVSTARQELSTAGPTTPPTTTTIFDDEETTLANTLIKLKDDKAKGIAFKDSKDTNRPARSILTLKPLPTIDPKDKGKGVLKELESAKKMTKSDFVAAQIARDEEIARQLEVELQAEVEKERQREEQASMNYIANLYDEVQAIIDVDHELVVRWTHEEQKKYTVVERAKLLAEYFERRKKQLAEKRYCYQKQASNQNSIEKGLYMKEHELIADFVPIGSEEDERRIRDMNKKAEEESSDKERRYPFTTKTLERMLSLRLIAESVSDVAYDLPRFIKKQIDKSGGYDR
nr:hypothetical protein [Tanacetum cinerariifolium]